MQYTKVKSVGKTVLSEPKEIEERTLRAMDKIANIVGATLGPGGKQVLIERQEVNLSPILTKDGVTVFRNLGFKDPVEHIVMESARDAAIKTATDAGDGTSSCTILANSIAQYMYSFCKSNPKLSPQKIIREIQSIFKNKISTLLDKITINIDSTTPEGQKLMWGIANISANGDKDLADTVMECFKLIGDEGNITISEFSGPSHYEIEKINGYTIPIGFEDSCAKYYPLFINDIGNQRIYLENALFVLYNSKIMDVATLAPILNKVFDMWQNKEANGPHNVVVVSTGFTETVLGELGYNFTNPSSLNIVPVVAPKGMLLNTELHFLMDLAAFTGAKVFDSVSSPIERAELTDLGRPVKSFEMYRYRGNIIAEPDEVLIFDRFNELEQQKKQAGSQLEASILQERMALLVGGIAKLKVIGASNGELKERRDRAEDAICAVRGALKHGCLLGGGWSLLFLIEELGKMITNDFEDSIYNNILKPALYRPFNILLSNVGLNTEEKDAVGSQMSKCISIVMDKCLNQNSKIALEDMIVYDAQSGRLVKPLVDGSLILDSKPAVLEALRNSISIATLLGTLGGIVVFDRDEELERQEAKDTYNYLQDSGTLK